MCFKKTQFYPQVIHTPEKSRENPKNRGAELVNNQGLKKIKSQSVTQG